MIDLTFANRKFSRGHQRIADYISKNVDNIPYMVEEDLAHACEVSISTVSRFWAEIGFKNLKDFKQQVKDAAQISPVRKLQSAFDKMSENSPGAHLLTSADYLEQTAQHLDQEHFEQAAAMLSHAGTVYLYGPGSAEALAALMDFRLMRFGVEVRRLDRGGHELLNSLIHIREQDVIVIFGFVSESPEMAVLFDFARSRGCSTLLITDLLVSDMRPKADLVLYTARGELWEFHSMVAPIALVETLIVAVGKQRGQQALQGSEELHKLRHQYQRWLPKRV
ncbi:MurR/RpiR family transcriptional regulator [Paenibacillus physcomitrellae]|uniref:RpiR family transcriptional regulator n=1 Tax=Paenibacillus physcomitrellae TaxID=1619311 RepID=A0ABQ1G143_9BACL|nr:MurR/RpiR family transcriptional regulator [Paenibacillus physcomitrellae]GGA33998.1 RpiR family transcriptional regulator [Paenibacillus physcomitrellae]